MIFIYSTLMKCLRLLLPFLKHLPHEKIKYFFRNQGQIQNLKKIESPIWIHASSGEIEYARPLIREMKSKHPDIPLLVTHTSLSSLKALKNLDVEAYGVAPLDETSEVRKFLKQWSPRACLIARTDLWPLTLKELHKQNIPAYLFSATFSKGTKKISLGSRLLLRSTLHQLSEVFFVSSADQEVCRDVYPKIRGQAIGDTRYDQVFLRLNQPSPIQIPSFAKLLIAGSTWSQDENVLVETTSALKLQGWKWIWVPHEIHNSHLLQLESELKRKGMKSVRLNHLKTNFSWSDWDVLIVDQVGALASLYKEARIAFVGGSFRKQVHSVMEALGAGLPVIVGPFHHNNREALEFKTQGFVKEVHNAEEFVQAVAVLDQTWSQIHSELQTKMQSKRGATHRLMTIMESEGLFSKSSKNGFQTS